MSTFLNRFAVDGRFGKGGGMLGRAKAAGYSDKQIATAIGRGGHGLRIGQVLRPGSSLHTQMATSNKGRPGNWIFNYMGASGAVGMEGLNRALGAGRTAEELISAGGLTSGGTQNYGVAGFGQEASDYLKQLQKEEAELKARKLQEEAVEEDPQWATDLSQTLTDLTKQINEPAVDPTEMGGYSTASYVGGGGTASMKIKEPKRGSRDKGTRKFRRSSWSMPTTNTASGKASNSSAVNV